MLARGDLAMEAEIVSDTAPLHDLMEHLLAAAPSTRWLRDATRGGVGTVCNELARDSNLTVVLDESELPVRPAVGAACELLGIDPLYVANEGKFVAVVAASWGATTATNFPCWRRTAGRCRAARTPATAGGPEGRSSSTTVRLLPGPARCRPCPTPPRVGSRSHRVEGAAASRSSTSRSSGAVSETISASRARSPRASITAMPWSPIAPERCTTSRQPPSAERQIAAAGSVRRRRSRCTARPPRRGRRLWCHR